jgi:hypothetical protein
MSVSIPFSSLLCACCTSLCSEFLLSCGGVPSARRSSRCVSGKVAGDREDTGEGEQTRLVRYAPRRSPDARPCSLCGPLHLHLPVGLWPRAKQQSRAEQSRESSANDTTRGNRSGLGRRGGTEPAGEGPVLPVPRIRASVGFAFGIPTCRRRD